MYYQVVPVGGLLLILVFSPRIDVQSQFCRIQKITSGWVFLVGYLLGGFFVVFLFFVANNKVPTHSVQGAESIFFTISAF